jgi:hypothetical protein
VAAALEHGKRGDPPEALLLGDVGLDAVARVPGRHVDREDLPRLQTALDRGAVHVGDGGEETALDAVDEEGEGLLGLRGHERRVAVGIEEVPAALEEVDVEALDGAARIVHGEGAEGELVGPGELPADLGEVLPGAEVGVDAQALELVGAVVEHRDGGVRVDGVDRALLAERGEPGRDQIVPEGLDVLGEVDQELGGDVPAQHAGERPDLESGDVRGAGAGDRLRDQLRHQVGRADLGDAHVVAELRVLLRHGDRLGEEVDVAVVVGPQVQRDLPGLDGGVGGAAAGAQRAGGREAEGDAGAAAEQIAPTESRWSVGGCRRGGETSCGSSPVGAWVHRKYS